MKINSSASNPTMRDPVIYRIKYHPHPKTKKQWSIYPLYDFTHCISDSLEDIAHSLCTLEFEIRRDLYYWILDNLDIYKPKVWEYSRMNISNTVLSKRKLSLLVEKGIVNGWDDPRLPTLEGLKRRGYTPSAINKFCDLVNVTRRGNENFHPISLLELCISKELDQNCERTMAVLDPVCLEFIDFPIGYCEKIIYKKHQKNEKFGNGEISLSKKIFIDRNDFNFEEFKLNQKEIYLKYLGIVEIIKVDLNDKTGEIEKIYGKIKERKLQTQNHFNNKFYHSFIHWISYEDAINCEVRLFDHLFKVENPNSLKKLTDGINENSIIVKDNAKINKNLKINDFLDKFQFERLGYFCVDYNSNLNEKKYVFNLTVNLNKKKKQMNN